MFGYTIASGAEFLALGGCFGICMLNAEYLLPLRAPDEYVLPPRSIYNISERSGRLTNQLGSAFTEDSFVDR